MNELSKFGLPVFLDDATHELTFGEGVVCGGGSSKHLQKMKGLLYRESAVENCDELCYVFCHDIYREEDRHLFEKRQYANGITVLMPGTMGGECRKNSGHYHGYVPGHICTFPEVYEVLTGEAVFLLQESRNFDHADEELKVETLRAVFLKAGEKIIVPPFCGHCAINVGEKPMAFGNLAAPSPLLYAPIQQRHGLGVYVLNIQGRIVFVPNSHYKDLPQLTIVQAHENPALGITFGKSVYESFVSSPERFNFLDEPEQYQEEIEHMLG